MINSPPGTIAVGAIGGSGSRVIARILQAAGIFMGADLNGAQDNLEFTARFRDTAILGCSEAGFAARYDEFTKASQAGMVAAGRTRRGWKEPNTHVVIDRLLARDPGLRYVHLLRNGFDMAHSGNQNQPRRWGPALLGRAVAEPPTPADALAWFCHVHRRISALAADPGLAGRILVLDYETLCAEPLGTITRLMAFVGHTPAQPLAELAGLVEPAASIGRARAHGFGGYDADDLAYMRRHLPAMVAAAEPASDQALA